MVTDRSVVVVVVGAGLGGLRTAEALRRSGHRGQIVVVGDEVHFPYDRPPLTKQVLVGAQRTTSFDDTTGAIDITIAGGAGAVRLDADEQQVQLTDGRRLDYDVLVVATGAHPVVPAGMELRDGLHVIRTIDQAHRVADALAAGEDVTVVGGGFIGCEVASSARQLGRDARIIEALPAPLLGPLGAEAAAVVARLHIENGVELLTGARVSSIDGDPVSGVVLDDGRRLAARHVVVALGSRPATAWLADSGIELDPLGGVLCDARGRSSLPNVYAVGDAATWWHPLAGRHVHVEHWTTTTEHAGTVATAIAAGPDAVPELADVPYFWSDQHGIKIQALGFVGGTDEIEVLHPRDRTVVLYGEGGVVRGVVGFAAIPEVMRMRRLIAERQPMAAAVAAVTGA